MFPKKDIVGDEKMKRTRTELILAIVLTIFFFFGGVKAYSYTEVWMPDTSEESGNTIAIPVIVSDVTGEDIIGFQMSLAFDSLVLIADSAYTTGTIAEAWGSPTFNDLIPGEMRIAISSAYALSGSGVLMYVVFIVTGSEGDTTTIHFEQMLLNEDPPDVISDGFFEVSPGTDVGEENEPTGQPDRLTLFQNYPNPFNPITVIRYALPHECEVEITVYNISGQKVKTLAKQKERAGHRQVIWDGRNDEGEEVATGVYLYKIQAGEFTQSKKMVIIK